MCGAFCSDYLTTLACILLAYSTCATFPQSPIGRALDANIRILNRRTTKKKKKKQAHARNNKIKEEKHKWKRAVCDHVQKKAKDQRSRFLQEYENILHT
jgi:hypothetical protein